MNQAHLVVAIVMAVTNSVIHRADPRDVIYSLDTVLVGDAIMPDFGREKSTRGGWRATEAVRSIGGVTFHGWSCDTSGDICSHGRCDL